MTLRTRLILAFLALALVPLLLLTTFSLDRLDRATRLWSAPAVEHALGSALEVSKTSLHRMESAVRAQAETWAEALPDVPMDDGRRAAVRAALPATALDVLQVYREVDGRWRREEDLRPEGVLDPMALDLSDRIAGALAGERAVRASEGALVGVWPDGPQRAIVAGYRVPPGFFDEVERVGVGVGFYRRFAIVSQVSRTYLLLLVIALALLLTAVAVLVATRLARGMTRPLAALEDAVQRVAAGDLSVRVEPAGARELRTLGARFNQMTDGLAEARERIKEAEREAAWREVARRLAHEFRNLLMPMGLSVNRIHRRLPAVRAEDREAMEESLASVSDAMGQLKRLTDQFEQYARLPEPRLERVDLGDVIRSTLRLHEHEGVHVSMTGDQVLAVTGDPMLLSRALHNLVLNACEASPNGATVEVHTARVGDRAVVEVLDRGSGLAPEARARLFEPYVSTKHRGSGLGLSLVRDTVNQHGGRVTLDDRDGGGTVARLELPLAADTP